MSTRPTLDAVRPFLRGPHRTVLATLGHDGRPHVVVVDYLVEDDGLMLNGRDGRRWVANLRRDRRATALVHDPYSVEHWVSVAGRAELLREGDDESVEDAKAMARRYGDDPEQFNGQHRVTWRLLPERVIERGEGPVDRWRGVVIAEGLTEPSLINDLVIDRACISERGQPLDDAGTLGRWHLYWVDVDREAVEKVQASTVHGWYSHFWRDDRLLVVYDDACFDVQRLDPSTWHEAVEHGLSQGIPLGQLDFPTDGSAGTLSGRSDAGPSEAAPA